MLAISDLVKLINLEVGIKKKLSGHHNARPGPGAGGQQEDKP